MKPFGMTMTPARALREKQKRDELEQKIRDDKFTEFSMACSEGDIHSCHSLGEWWAVVKQQYSKAAGIYKSNCEDHSHGTSCYKLGVLYANGRGVAKSKRRAVESFRLGCENGNGDSCYYSGWLTLAGKGVARDTSKGVRLLRQGCKLTHGKCCSMIGSMLAVGSPENGVAKNPKEALRMLALGCDKHDANACRNLSVMYAKGDGVAKDMEKANHFGERARELYVQDGVTVPPPQPTAAAGAASARGGDG